MNQNFRDIQWLRQHVLKTLDFWYPACMDNDAGGYINQLRDDGSVYDHETKHVVATTRFIYTLSIGKLLHGDRDYESGIEHGIHFLNSHHRDPVHGGYFTMLKGNIPQDRTKQAYGHAFVLLAAATAYRAGIDNALDLMETVYSVIEKWFFDKRHGLCVDVISEDWSVVDPYRGQNANMHMCEAMIAAYEATGNEKYIIRAIEIAQSVAVRLSALTGGLIWEHYSEDWQVDWQRNIDDPKNFWRPYGFLIGHLFEWSKLLGVLERHYQEDWLLKKAVHLYNIASGKGWDSKHGGFYFTVDRKLQPVVTDKYHWVMAEAIGASAVLGSRLRQEAYMGWYDRIWDYCTTNLIDHERGGWYRILSERNARNSSLKGDGVEPDYHPIGACYESIRCLADIDI